MAKKQPNQLQCIFYKEFKQNFTLVVFILQKIPIIVIFAIYQKLREQHSSSSKESSLEKSFEGIKNLNHQVLIKIEAVSIYQLKVTIRKLLWMKCRIYRHICPNVN